DAGEHKRDDHDRRRPAHRHQNLEGRVVMTRADQVRRQEDCKRSGRILHEEIAVRDAAVEDGVSEPLVEMDVAVARRPQETAVGNGAYVTARSMNSFQIVAGNVGPETSIPWTDSIGFSPRG